MFYSNNLKGFLVVKNKLHVPVHSKQDIYNLKNLFCILSAYTFAPKYFFWDLTLDLVA